MREPSGSDAALHVPDDATLAARNALERPALFRQVVIESAAGTQIGEPLHTYWKGMTWFAVLAVCVVGGMLAFLIVVEYAPIHRVPAYVDVASGLIRLSAIQDARVSTIVVEEGATVAKGAVLAVLNTDRQGLDGGYRQVQLRQKLNVERAMLAREIDAARQEALVTRDIADQRIAGLRDERGSLLKDLDSAEELLTSLRSQFERIAELAVGGFVARMQADQRRDEVRVQESRTAAARAALARVSRDIGTSTAERGLADTKLAALIESRERVRGELDRLMVQTESDAEHVIVAPESGVVSSSLVTRGQSVASGQTMFTLSPQGGALIVRLLVPARAAAAVRPGLSVKLVFRAFPQERFGEFDARIERVSDTLLMPVDLPPIYVGQGAAFTAVASVATELRDPAGRVIKLKAGMLADALVPIERRSAIEWMLAPVLSGFNNSAGRVREPTGDTTP